MSKNVIDTVGQHVFRYEPPEFTESGAPFLAHNSQKEIKAQVKDHFQFLGEGYYFWDNNIQRAKIWGEMHYEGKYKILEIPLVLQGDDFLDLAGSREDIANFCSLYDYYKDTFGYQGIGAFISGMMTLAKKNPKVWPYKVVRALNVKRKAPSSSFNHLKDSKMLLDPEIIVCFYDRDKINLSLSRVI